jgi:hypothetical protein
MSERTNRVNRDYLILAQSFAWSFNITDSVAERMYTFVKGTPPEVQYTPQPEAYSQKNKRLLWDEHEPCPGVQVQA